MGFYDGLSPADYGNDIDGYAEAVRLVLLGWANEPWREEAACKGMDPNLWYPDRGEIPTEAFVTCGNCNVWLDCLAWAVRNREEDGVMGRMRASERVRYAEEIKAKGWEPGSAEAEQHARDTVIIRLPAATYEFDRPTGPPLHEHPLNSFVQTSLF